ncbi:hypothetical protein EXN66_Car008000 [Channa argus]|uniref:Uncharacterized protein n=1 Tax=Channa argus TaxID=215402 RepID=A0A6G1PQA1_CHAAH|nr:hypothetical protein EXN66_Car008000 [Channa argus]
MPHSATNTCESRLKNTFATDGRQVGRKVEGRRQTPRREKSKKPRDPACAGASEEEEDGGRGGGGRGRAKEEGSGRERQGRTSTSREREREREADTEVYRQQQRAECSVQAGH